MNKSMIRYILSWILLLEGIFMLLPWAVGLFYREDTTWYFLLVGICCIIAGLILTRFKPTRTVV